MREYIRTGHCDRMIEIMSEESKEAKVILERCRLHFKELWYFIQWMLLLDDMNIRGEQIVLIRNNYAKEDQQFIKCVFDRNADMIRFVNSVCVGETACEGGAVREGALQLPPHPNQIWLVDIHGIVKYRMGACAGLEIRDETGNRRISKATYLNDTYIMLDGVILHLLEFAEIIETNHYKVVPVETKPSGTDYGIYRVPRTRQEIRKHKKMIARMKTET